MIIGITGTYGAGKGTIVDFLKKKGFLHFSVSGYITELLIERGMPVNRDNMILLANELREKNPSYLVERLYERAKQNGGNCVIESLRTVGEIETLRKKGKFILFAIDAEQKLRYDRSVLRASEKDSVSFEEFVSQENFESKNKEPFKQNLFDCMDLADYKFLNNGSLDELEKNVENVLEMIEQGVCDYSRPSWDDYFLEVMDSIGKRVTCNRARVSGGGCVVVRDKRILVTGYAGSAPGEGHCDDIGHQFKKTIHEDGRTTNHCIRTIHAEQNAICQAARIGVSLLDSIMYVCMFPCYTCAKLIVASGIKKVICKKDYQASEDSKNLFKKCGVEFEVVDKEITKY